MRNAVALKLGSCSKCPFTNHCQPIRVYFNGIFKGAYFITEKIGITGASVDIDEETGILFEMDTNFDEDYKFWSRYYNLPMMVKDPDLSEIAEVKGVTPESLLSSWRDDFTEFERKVYMGEDLSTSLDMESLVNYPHSLQCVRQPRACVAQECLSLQGQSPRCLSLWSPFGISTGALPTTTGWRTR